MRLMPPILDDIAINSTSREQARAIRERRPRDHEHLCTNERVEARAHILVEAERNGAALQRMNQLFKVVRSALREDNDWQVRMACNKGSEQW